jgi:hypothetical protein
MCESAHAQDTERDGTSECQKSLPESGFISDFLFRARLLRSLAPVGMLNGYSGGDGLPSVSVVIIWTVYALIREMFLVRSPYFFTRKSLP